ncbi:MAG: LemA family protein [Proteobacteria bacterium]|nr:LemA family protein [Pseudomonadota bacterium]
MRHWLAAVLFLSLSASLMSGCGYRQIQADDEQVLAVASEYIALSQRRADQVPSLVRVVQAYAPNEREALEQVGIARAAVVAHMPASPDALGGPATVVAFSQGNLALSRALDGLLAISENYPALKADAGFRDLQAQLEEAGGRIDAAQHRYADVVKTYNTEIGGWPNNLLAMLMGAKPKGEIP